ncbi:hypothetical protein KQX54_021663 [Cotesia glomerata]|uniref:C2H2-type domain-containing protein n=1 Tax=Cotesia glomerata TaxID=32391 RepID=A0AAV7J8X5_COTGL|nr:hypothetical protein KQX54_021663 [Cotesia glomerata]
MKAFCFEVLKFSRSRRLLQLQHFRFLAITFHVTMPFSTFTSHQCARVPQFGKNEAIVNYPWPRSLHQLLNNLTRNKLKLNVLSVRRPCYLAVENLHIRIQSEPRVLFSEPDDKPEEQNYTVPLKRTLIRTGGYRCGVCQSPFVLRDLAVAHLRSAHPMMPYQCPYCKQRFTTQYEFSHHIKTSHPNESE